MTGFSTWPDTPQTTPSPDGAKESDPVRGLLEPSQLLQLAHYVAQVLKQHAGEGETLQRSTTALCSSSGGPS
jgi:hypothetical protein